MKETIFKDGSLSQGKQLVQSDENQSVIRRLKLNPTFDAAWSV